MTAKLVGVLAIFGACAGAQDAAEIVRRSVMADQRTFEKAKDYAYTETHVEHDLDAAGKATSTESKTYDVIVLYGRPFRKLVARNGAPLSAAERAKEEARLQKAIDQRRGEANRTAIKRKRAQRKTGTRSAKWPASCRNRTA